MTSANGTVTEGSVTGINWSIVTLADALDAAELDDLQPIANLLNSGGPITIDGSNANTGLDMFELLDEDITTLITQPITVSGSSFEDRLFGGAGNDLIDLGGDGGDFARNSIFLTLGNDTIDFSDVSNSTLAFLNAARFVSGPVTFTVNSATNTGNVSGTGFNTTLVDPRTLMASTSAGLELFGGTSNDVFNITTTASDDFLQIFGNEGSDTFNLTLNTSVRLSYTFGANGLPSAGLVADLSTGIVSNDGFGGQDTINILGGDGRLEIRATDNNDSITGSDRNESFITEQGNDTVNGGDGFDRVRYDRSGGDAVNVNLATGTATGTWDGIAFTDTLVSIEYIRGSRQGDDTIVGSDADESFEGRGGDDSIIGGAGDDTLRGEDGNDTLTGGAGENRLDGGAGDDLFIMSAESDFDYIVTGLGNDTVDLRNATSFADIAVEEGTGPATITIDVVNDNFNIVNGNDGTTTVLGGRSVITDPSGGMFVFGTGSSDTFNVTQDSGGFLGLNGRVVRAMFANAWAQRSDQLIATKRALTQKVKKLEGEIDRMLDRIADTSSDRAALAYERKVDRLEEDKLLTQEKLAQMGASKGMASKTIELALGFLSNPWKI